MIIDIISSLSTGGQVATAVALLIGALYIRRVVGIVALLSNALSMVAIMIGVIALATLFGWIDPNIGGLVEDIGAIRSVVDALIQLVN